MLPPPPSQVSTGLAVLWAEHISQDHFAHALLEYLISSTQTISHAQLTSPPFALGLDSCTSQGHSSPKHTNLLLQCSEEATRKGVRKRGCSGRAPSALGGWSCCHPGWAVKPETKKTNGAPCDQTHVTWQFRWCNYNNVQIQFICCPEIWILTSARNY